MKKVILLVCLLLAFCVPAYAMDDSQVVDSFRQYVQSNISLVEDSYKGNKYEVKYIKADYFSGAYWIKYATTLDPAYKIDVQKTNSLISPYVGTLEVDRNTVTYSGKTKEDAINQIGTKYSYVDNFKFTIAYQGTGWVVTRATQRNYALAIREEVSLNILDVLKCSYPEQPTL